jgi:phosphatidate cytidylyltransferase
VSERAAAEAGAPSKTKKILKRTSVGSLLVLGLASALWLTSRSGDGRPIFYVTAAVLVFAAFELSRLGSLASRDSWLVLLAAVVGALFLEDSAIRELKLSGASLRELDPYFPASARRGYAPSYLVECAAALGLACAAFGFLRALRAFRIDERVTHVLFVVALSMLAFALRANAEDARSWLVVGAVPLAIMCATTLPLALRASRSAARELLIALALAVWLVPPLPALWHVWRDYGSAGLVALLALSKIGDTAAYYVGNAIGKTHPFPTISPGKTTAGCVASFVTATVVGGALVFFGVLPSAPLGIAGGLAAGAVVNVAAQAGDLLESFVKRRAGVKDSSRAFGPSGGMLDQIDSLLVSIPVALATWPWLFTSG